MTINRVTAYGAVGLLVGAALLWGIAYARPPAETVLAGSLVNRVVVVDPGHGGPDPGSVGRSGSLEKHIVLSISQLLRQNLERAGLRVVMTREDDLDLSGMEDGTLGTRKRLDLHARVEVINTSEADIALSIHANSIGSSRWSGAQTFYFSMGPLATQNARLAIAIQDQLRLITERTRRVASDKVDQFILEQAKVPAATVEVGFISNDAEEQLLLSEVYQRRVAWAIFLGAARYLTEGALPATTGEPSYPVCLRVWGATARAGSLAVLQPNPLTSLVPDLMCTIRNGSH